MEKIEALNATHDELFHLLDQHKKVPKDGIWADCRAEVIF